MWTVQWPERFTSALNHKSRINRGCCRETCIYKVVVDIDQGIRNVKLFAFSLNLLNIQLMYNAVSIIIIIIFRGGEYSTFTQVPEYTFEVNFNSLWEKYEMFTFLGADYNVYVHLGCRAHF